MTALVLGLILVPVVDQAVKRFVCARLGRNTLSLGVLGHVRLVQTQIWTMRAWRGVSLQVLWGMWTAAAGASAVICAVVPVFGWPFGLLLGGALSHAIETSVRGSICDYVCLRFWPAFNLADVALTIGALGLTIEFAAVVS
jgi:lipoprotein signal peptidase